MNFRLLGALEVSANGVVPELSPPKQRALLAILLLHPGEIVPVDRLIEFIRSSVGWPARARSGTKNELRSSMSISDGGRAQRSPFRLGGH